MAYYPKSQITTNLHTNGDEFFLINSETPYSGYYYKISNNKKYTGKNPDAGMGIELIPNTTLNGNPPPTPFAPSTITTIRSTINMSDKDDSLLHYNNSVTVVYPKLQDFESRALPSPDYPKPTPQDIQIGEYRRYFAKKSNELIYMEISKETYTKFSSNDPKVATDVYEVLFLPWSLKYKPSSTNKSIVSIVERNNKWYGFTLYFKGQFG